MSYGLLYDIFMELYYSFGSKKEKEESHTGLKKHQSDIFEWPIPLKVKCIQKAL